MKNPSHLLLIAVLPLTVVGAGLANTPGVETDVMNDRFAIERFDPPAGGFVKTQLTQQGAIEILMLQVHGLEGDREYEVVVAVGADGETEFCPVVIAESGPISANAGGHFVLTNFHVADFDPGTYRVDIIVMPPGDGLDRDFLLACEPAPFVTVE
jgi:hypothetical protein